MTGDERRARAEEMLDGEAIFWDQCDAAIVGVSQGERVVYEWHRLVGVFVAQGMTPDEAEEWVSFNILDAYVGERTPIIITSVAEEWT